MNLLAVIIIMLTVFISIVMVIAGLPGTFVAAGGLLIVALLGGFEVISLKWVLIFLVGAVLGEGMEYVAGLLGAKKYGASTKGVFGAILGGMSGAVILTPLIPGSGIIIGMFAGTFLGALVGEYISGRDIVSSRRVGWGAFLGRVFAVGLKVLIVLSVGSVAIYKYLYGA